MKLKINKVFQTRVDVSSTLETRPVVYYKYKSMIGKIVNFIQYNNFFTLTLMFVFMGASATFAASPDARASIIDQKETVRSVDNTYLINTDFTLFEVGLKIQSVKEDDEWYYIDYTYNTAEVVDYVWMRVAKTASMKVTKKELGAKDLGLYVAEQLGQVTDQKLAYLQDIQKIEKKIGMTQKVVATEYSGLVGQFLSADEKTFEGYVPVKPPILVAAFESTGENTTLIGTELGTTYGVPTPTPLSPEQIQRLISDAVRQLLAGDTATTTASTTIAVIDTPTTGGGGGSTPAVSTGTTTPVDTSTSTPVIASTTPTVTGTTTPAVTPTASTTPSTTATTTPSDPVATSTPAEPTPVSEPVTTPEPTPTPTPTPTPEPVVEPTPAPEPTPTPEPAPAPVDAVTTTP